ncbi:MAG TPA: TonB family protein [Bacteroidia bacterium]|nr:TonB family protein [Bacteroidia bacterium]
MSRNLLLIILFFSVKLAQGQDTTYLDKELLKVNSKSEAHFYEIVTPDAIDTSRSTETVYYISGQISSKKSYVKQDQKKLDGKFQEWYKNGRLHTDIDYSDGKINGKRLSYWEDGTPKRIDTFENDSLIEGKCFNPDGVETAYYEYEKMPEFPGGLDELVRYLSKEIKYPNKARKNSVQGLVMVRFIVNKDGSVSDIKIVKSVDERLDSEAVRVVQNMPHWDPGTQDGESVRVVFNLPIRFKLK